MPRGKYDHTRLMRFRIVEKHSAFGKLRGRYWYPQFFSDGKWSDYKHHTSSVAFPEAQQALDWLHDRHGIMTIVLNYDGTVPLDNNN